ncbi:general amino acid permease [Phaffia rhodozyma]|uniref:General amino acid permease n=1 Tax=Phaffia rhodozyma TaxID=264483 RepID=A0A0F7SHF8_PHARH|nr:general amino acid permease [Phaffia rhodozyma]
MDQLECKKDIISVDIEEVNGIEGGLNRQMNHTKRVMTAKQIRFLAIGGTIGTAVFLGIGGSLVKGGPLMLLLGYILWTSVIFCVNEGQAEMVCQLPVESSFITFASRYVDNAFGGATGWNYFLAMCSLLCFEITAFHAALGYWTSDVHPAIVPVVCIVTYALLHMWSSRIFAETEFWIVLCKIVLMLGLFMFTFVTMCGGNPLKDAYGFRHWKNPGPISDYYGKNSSGYFQGFWTCLLGASFAVAGPDFLSLVAAEAINPRQVLPSAFKSVYIRLILFFLVSALAVGIVVPYDDVILNDAIKENSAGAGRSPYVAAMSRLKIKYLGSIVNAGIITSIYSAGSAFLFNGSRTLHGLAQAGHAPAFFKRTNKNGVPVYALIATLCFACLSFLQCSDRANKVLEWFINISTATQIVTWMAMSVSHIRWFKAMAIQNIDRSTLPYRSMFQPYGAWYALVLSTIVMISNGYPVFLNGGWDTASFIFSYAAPILFVIFYAVIKLIGRKPFAKLEDIDLREGLAEVEEHEATLSFQEIENDSSEKIGKRIIRWLF